MSRFLAIAHAAFLILSSTVLLAAEPRGVVYVFSASWCGPCQQVAPIVEKLNREGLPIQKIDIEQKKDLASKYNIQSIPTFVLIVDNQVKKTQSGAMSEAQMRQMVASIPKSETPVARPSQSGPGFPIDLGQPGELKRTLPSGRAEETRVAQAEPRKGIKDLWPFGRKEDAAREPAVVRGNDGGLQQTGATQTIGSQPLEMSPSKTPMDASVRIRVISNNKIELGSGTIIDSQSGQALILTCAHIFKTYTPDSQIEVDVFHNGIAKLHHAKLIKHHHDSDVGLISIKAEQVVFASPVATRVAAPRQGEPVVAIGCGGGSDPTAQQLQITDIDRYDGPHNILCTGVPVSGRSGGGLFNARGEVIGVCSAADTSSPDKSEHRGFYSGLFAVHKLLDECSLTHLYAPQNEAPAATTTLADASQIPAEFQSPPVVQLSSNDHVPAATDLKASDTEVVVVIRDTTQPEATNRVIIIHQPSEKFLSYLSGELPSGNRDSGVASQQVTSSHGTGRPAAGVMHSPAAQKELLQPTGLSQSVAPQRYVRTR